MSLLDGDPVESRFAAPCLSRLLGQRSCAKVRTGYMGRVRSRHVRCSPCLSSRNAVESARQIMVLAPFAPGFSGIALDLDATVRQRSTDGRRALQGETRVTFLL
jgi:hypothetical protein